MVDAAELAKLFLVAADGVRPWSGAPRMYSGEEAAAMLVTERVLRAIASVYEKAASPIPDDDGGACAVL